MPFRIDDEGRTLAVRGVFDTEEARQVTEAALDLRAPGVVIDLRDAREIHDADLVRLVLVLVKAGRRLELHGLRQHQRRILRYLSLPSAEPAPA